MKYGGWNIKYGPQIALRLSTTFAVGLRHALSASHTATLGTIFLDDEILDEAILNDASLRDVIVGDAMS